MGSIVNVLGMGDIHFGMEPTPTIDKTLIAQRAGVLDKLLETLQKVPAEFRPNAIAINGDIGWRGSAADYAAAKPWIENLLKVTQLTPADLVPGAGNHEVDRPKTKGMLPLSKAEEADDWLRVENLENFRRPFQAFEEFCKGFGIPPLTIGAESSYLVGQRMLHGVRFVVLNSAWFCRGNEDRGKLWIGLPQLEVMEASKQLPGPAEYDTTPLTVAVVHHPPGWINDSDTGTYKERESPYRFLALRSHIILSGHIHGAVEEPHRMHNHAQLYLLGATFQENTYRHNVSILQLDIEKRTVTRLVIEYDPRNHAWIIREPLPSLPLVSPYRSGILPAPAPGLTFSSKVVATVRETTPLKAGIVSSYLWGDATSTWLSTQRAVVEEATKIADLKDDWLTVIKLFPNFSRETLPDYFSGYDRSVGLQGIELGFTMTIHNGNSTPAFLTPLPKRNVCLPSSAWDCSSAIPSYSVTIADLEPDNVLRIEGNATKHVPVAVSLFFEQVNSRASMLPHQVAFMLLEASQALARLANGLLTGVEVAFDVEGGAIQTVRVAIEVKDELGLLKVQPVDVPGFIARWKNIQQAGMDVLLAKAEAARSSSAPASSEPAATKGAAKKRKNTAPKTASPPRKREPKKKPKDSAD